MCRLTACACPQACEPFTSKHPTTISMSVLVVVEMFNALNNLSEDSSLLRVGLSVGCQGVRSKGRAARVRVGLSVGGQGMSWKGRLPDCGWVSVGCQGMAGRGGVPGRGLKL